MGEELSWAPAFIDRHKPSAARLYDYYLGGSHNFAADREMGRKALAIEPRMRNVALENRAFLQRVVRELAGTGVDQFLDLGAGIPTVGNTHDIAHQVSPDARIVYVDNDPVAVAHARAMLAEDRLTGVVEADLRTPDRVLAAVREQGLLDPDRAVAVLFIAVLHFVTDPEDPAGIVRAFADGLPEGSHIAISHATREGREDEADAFERLYRHASVPICVRGRAEITAMFDGLELIDPGVTVLQEWRPTVPPPERDPAGSWGLGGVARVPH